MRMHELIRQIHLLWKPNFSIKFSKKTHYTLSYALLISSLRVINHDFPFLLFLRWWSVLKATSILSEINLLDMKALYDSETSLRKIFFRRFPMVLEIVLYRTLQRLMGRKSLAFSREPELFIATRSPLWPLAHKLYLWELGPAHDSHQPWTRLWLELAASFFELRSSGWYQKIISSNSITLCDMLQL